MFKRIFVLFLCASLAAMSLTACDKTSVTPDYDPIAIAIVVGRTVGSNEYAESMYAEVDDWVRRASIGGYVCIIVADGEPFIAKVFGAETFPINAKTKHSMNQFIDSRTKKVMEFIKSDAVLPANDETDVIGALILAERALRADEAYGLERRVLIMHNGLPTAGSLSLNNPETAITVNGLENGDIDRIVSGLKNARGVLPDFSGISVKWVGMGNTAAPQQLPSAIGVQVESLWQTILRDTGAIFSDNDIRIKATGGTPIIYIEGVTKQVSTIHFDAKLEREPGYVMGIDASMPEMEDESGEDGDFVVSITSESVEFIPDEAIFWDEPEARRVIKEYAELVKVSLEANKDMQIYIVGFSAKITLNGNSTRTDLSERRAAAVASVMVEYGVPSDRLISFGLGPNGGSELRVDEFAGGEFNNTTAQRNRKVMIMSDNASEATLALEIWHELESDRRR